MPIRIREIDHKVPGLRLWRILIILIRMGLQLVILRLVIVKEKEGIC